jgi:hypothetical protein
MSAHGHAAADPHAAGDDSHGHDHAYEGIPADRPAADEPATPPWLPLVGIGLVLGTILAYVVTRPEGQTSAQLASAAAAVAPPPAQPEQPEAAAQPERRAPRALPSGFRPGALGSALARPAGSARPGAPGPFAVPGGSAAPPRRRPPAGAVPAHGEPGHPPH